MPYTNKPRSIPGTDWKIYCVTRPCPPLSLKDRFESKVKVNELNGCWEWQACIGDVGYGKIEINGSSVGAHRASYELYINKIPNGFFICHKCDNKKCVNPNHFFLGTNADNLKDAQNKGIMPTAKCPSRTMYNKGCRCDECVHISREYSNRMRDKHKDAINKRRRDKYNLKNIV